MKMLYSSALQTRFFSWKQTRRTAPNLGPYCLQYRLPKNISRQGADDRSRDWLAPDQHRNFTGPDLGFSCLQIVSVDNRSPYKDILASHCS